MIIPSQFEHFYCGPTLRNHNQRWIPEVNDDPEMWDEAPPYQEEDLDSVEPSEWSFWVDQKYPELIKEAETAMAQAQKPWMSGGIARGGLAKHRPLLMLKLSIS